MYEDTPKTESSDRIVSISDSVMKKLREFKEEQDRTKAIMGEAWEEHNKLFTQFRGKPIHPLTITKWLAKFCKDNGLPHTTPHMLRHTSATLLLMQGLPLKAVSKRLGHAQLSTTVNLSKGNTPQSSHIRQRALPPKSSNARFFLSSIIEYRLRYCLKLVLTDKPNNANLHIE